MNLSISFYKIGFLCFLVTVGSTRAFATPKAYSCAVNFGEVIPIAAIHLDPKAWCGSCPMMIPNDIITSMTIWNWHVRDLPLKNKVKRSYINEAGSHAVVETRFVNYDSPSFRFIFDEESENFEFPMPDKRSPDYDDISKTKIRLNAIGPLYDRRVDNEQVFAELSYGNREEPRLIIRVFKYSIPNNSGYSMPTSASGEVLLSHLKSQFSVDVGADEYLEVEPKTFFRLEAAEIKIECQLEAEAQKVLRIQN